MPETVEMCASKRTVRQISDLTPIQLEPGQAPGVSEPRPLQGVEGVVAERQHLQAAELAEGVIGEARAGYSVVTQQQRPQLWKAVQGIFPNILNAISAQREQGEIKQEGQICTLYRGETSISDD